MAKKKKKLEEAVVEESLAVEESATEVEMPKEEVKEPKKAKKCDGKVKVMVTAQNVLYKGERYKHLDTPTICKEDAMKAKWCIIL